LFGQRRYFRFAYADATNKDAGAQKIPMLQLIASQMGEVHTLVVIMFSRGQMEV
jgi:hypothetical protein